MQEKIVKKIDVATFATTLGTFSGITGFIAGLIIAVLSSEIAVLFPTLTERTVILDVLLGESAIIILPIITFIGGFLEGLFFAVVYNYLVPKIGGGIKVSFE